MRKKKSTVESDTEFVSSVGNGGRGIYHEDSRSERWKLIFITGADVNISMPFFLVLKLLKNNLYYFFSENDYF